MVYGIDAAILRIRLHKLVATVGAEYHSLYSGWIDAHAEQRFFIVDATPDKGSDLREMRLKRRIEIRSLVDFELLDAAVGVGKRNDDAGHSCPKALRCMSQYD